VIERGKNIFETQCRSCHYIYRDATGPALKGVEYRGSWKNLQNLLNYLKNPARYSQQDTYAQYISNWSPAAHPAYELTPEDLRAIIAYINNGPTEGDSPMSSSGKTNSQTEGDRDCGYDTLYKSVRNNFPEYDTTRLPDVMQVTRRVDTSTTFNSPVNYYNEAYEFDIPENGWYNIDAFLKENQNKVENVKLMVDLKTTEEAFLNMYVLVPTERVMQYASGRKANKYYFDFNNGTIPLPIGERAIILAFGSTKDKLIYGISEFTISQDQTIPVVVNETTPERLKEYIASKNIIGVQIEAIKKERIIKKIPCGTELLHETLKDSTTKNK
jgi:hypothetical protein